VKIVYPDGSCMDCQFGPARDPAFTPGSAVISLLQGGQVRLDGIDGIREPSTGLGAASDAVWSTEGNLAVVRDGALWTGRPGKLTRVAVATAPSWSPTGDAIAALQVDGWW
jgi:hypothetical protein